MDPHEPERVGEAVARLGLRHVVITSVDRDDLDDGGAGHFARVIGAIRRLNPETTIEVLTPDFLRKDGAIERVVEARPDVFNHNLETVPRLYPTVRPGARYFHSLRLLDRVKQIDPRMFTKSGLMVGLGESREEVLQPMDDLRSGTWISSHPPISQPTPSIMDRPFWTPKSSKGCRMAKGSGVPDVSATPLTARFLTRPTRFRGRWVGAPLTPVGGRRRAGRNAEPRRSPFTAAYDTPPRLRHAFSRTFESYPSFLPWSRLPDLQAGRNVLMPTSGRLQRLSESFRSR